MYISVETALHLQARHTATYTYNHPRRIAITLEVLARLAGLEALAMCGVMSLGVNGGAGERVNPSNDPP